MEFNIATSTAVEIDGVKYELKYPTVGQILDIENKKMLLTNGEYSNYVKVPQKTYSMIWALDLVDALSHFAVLIPDLSKRLGCNSYLEIDQITAKKIVSAYKNDFRPWYSKLMTFIHDDTMSSIEE